VRTEAPLILPIFRSEGQGQLLARVYLAPDRPAPLAELARELDVDAGGLTREADRLEQAGLVRSERIGRQRLLRPNPGSPYYDALLRLLLTAFGPAALIGPALGGIDGVEKAFLFGSWAARYSGEEGDAPADVDVMVVGRPSRAEVARVARDLSERIGREVEATIVSADRWQEGRDGFIRTVKAGTLLPLDLRRGAPGRE
jgi:predicted nucleotidyltransferase